MCQKSELYQFVEELVSKGKEPVEGIHIKMANGMPMMNISLSENDNKVKITINNNEVGYFEPTSVVGYKCEFHQRYRRGMKANPNCEEWFIISICENHSDEVLLYEA